MYVCIYCIQFCYQQKQHASWNNTNKYKYIYYKIFKKYRDLVSLNIFASISFTNKTSSKKSFCRPSFLQMNIPLIIDIPWPLHQRYIGSFTTDSAFINHSCNTSTMREVYHNREWFVIGDCCGAGHARRVSHSVLGSGVCHVSYQSNAHKSSHASHTIRLQHNRDRRILRTEAVRAFARSTDMRITNDRIEPWIDLHNADCLRYRR